AEAAQQAHRRHPHVGEQHVAQARDQQRDVQPASSCRACFPWIRSTAFSALMMVGALVLPAIKVGVREASTTRRRLVPWTSSRGLTTARVSLPIWQVPAGW